MNPPVLPQTPWSLKPLAPDAEAPAPTNSPGPSGSLNASSWTAIGPASLNNNGFNSVSVDDTSGRVTGIAADPNDANVLYVAAAGGGVWKTTDGGTTWTPLTDSQTTLAMGSIAVAPSNGQKIYAGTGEANSSGDSNQGYGILVSNDGGASWTLENAGGAFAGNVIGQIAVDPTNANTAYAAVGSDYSENGISYINAGIWKTTDGGTTWTNTTATLSTKWPWTSVVVDPNTPSTIYAAIGSIYNAFFTNFVYRSTNSGSTWAKLANGPNGLVNADVGRIALAVSPAAKTAGHHVLYVAVADANSPYGLQIFSRSDNADAATPTFTDLTSGTPDFLGAENGSGQGWYDIAVNVDANGVVYCAGVENYGSTPQGLQAIIRSTDLGVTWTDISIVNNFEPHTDNHAIAFDASGRMLAGNDGGIFRYDPSSGGSWTDLNTNLNTIQFTGIGLHPTSLGIVIGGSQDNGAELYTDNLLWKQVEAGDGGFAQISQTNPTRCYEEYVYGAIERSDSSCAPGTWNPITFGLSAVYSNFYTPYTVDPTNGDHVLLGTDYVNDTTNGGNSWNPIGSPGTNNFNPNDLAVDSIALSPANGSNPAIVYAAVGGTFTSSSHIFVARENGTATTWTQIDLPACRTNPSSFLQGCRVNQIVTDPNDLTGHTAFAVTSNFTAGAGHVWKSNEGAPWTDISGNLPNLPTWSVQVDTDANHTVYISTDAGVYASASPYGTWEQFGTGLPNAQGYDLELNRNLQVLAVGTHGRGAWEILTSLTPQIINFTQPASPVTYSVGLTIPLTATGGGSGNPVVFTIDGASTASGTISGNTLTVTEAGTLVIDANQAGSAGFAAAAEVQRTVVVNQAAALISPAPGSTLTGTSATFSWTAGVGVKMYELRLGTTGPGSSDVYNVSGTTTTALTSPLITNIPAYGVTLYARLYSWINGGWQHNDYTYTESG
ncbi:MAG TPA: hypothetical protein VG225_12445, partial [Terracidiphilus sp.]|nr:hypothetical protein [Terracidiphilus sp.]